MNSRWLLWIIGLTFFLTCPGNLAAQSVAKDSLIQRISRRQQNLYLRIDNWQARVTSTTIWLDRNSESRQTRVVEKRFRIRDLEQYEEILHAEQWKDSGAVDITEHMIEAQKHFNIRSSLENLLFEELRNHGGDTLYASDLFPFSADHRPLYSYTVSDDSVIGNQPVYIVRATINTPDSRYYNGRFYVEKNTCDVLKAVFWPSKNSVFVKKLRGEFSFRIHPRGFYRLERLELLVDVNLAFINLLRRKWVEEYSQYQIFQETP